MLRLRVSWKANFDKEKDSGVFATNSNVLIPISVQPDGVNFLYFNSYYCKDQIPFLSEMNIITF